MSDATNDSDNNLPSEKDANPTNDEVMYSSYLLQIDKRGRGNKDSFNLLKFMLQII